jgi:branched-subunit amino acid ABC-type transport system permease component
MKELVVLGILNPSPFIVSGLVTGAVYGVLAMGLVFTYKVSRVVNFAYGVVAMFSAYCYWQFRVQWHWAIPLALLVAVVFIPSALALLSERVVYRRLSGGSVFSRTAASAGILLALFGVSQYIWNAPLTNETLLPPSLFSTAVVWRIPGVNITGEQVGVFVSVALIVALMFGFLRYSRPGLRLRAVVVNRGLAELRGVDSLMSSRLAWIVSYVVSALAGILIAPLIGGNPITLTSIVVFSLAAAVLGGLLSLPLALAGGLGLGVLGTLVLGYVPTGTVTTWASGVLPFAFLFVALIVQSRRLLVGHTGESKRAMLDDLASAATERRPNLKSNLAMAGLVLVASLILWSTHSVYLTVISNGVALSILYLSFRVFTATTGMVSFAQVAFAGIGAFSAANLITTDGIPWPLAVLLAGCITGLVGALVALPTVRLRGIFLALATLAFAQLVNTGLFSSEAFTGGFSGRPLRLPRLIQGSFVYLVVLVVAFVVIGYLCERFQHSIVGRELKADLGSSNGAQSIGIRPQQGRLLAFTVAAGIAGIAGALLGGIDQVVTTASFGVVPTVFLYLATVAIAGIGSTSFILQLGVLSAVFSQIFAVDFPNEGNAYVTIFGVTALFALRVPGGAFAMQVKQKKAMGRLIRRVRGQNTELPLIADSASM